MLRRRAIAQLGHGQTEDLRAPGSRVPAALSCLPHAGPRAGLRRDGRDVPASGSSHMSQWLSSPEAVSKSYAPIRGMSTSNIK